MKSVHCLIFLLLTSIIAKAKYDDTTILGYQFRFKVRDEHNLKITWRGIEKHIKFDLYNELELDSIERARKLFLIQESNKIKRLNSNIYALDKNNLFLAIAGKNSTILLLGLHLTSDYISIFKNMIQCDFSPLKISSPSLVIKKIGSKSYQFIAGHKEEYFEFADTAHLKYTTIDVITSYCCGNFFEEMHFPVIFNDKKQIDIYKNDIKYYEYVLGLKEIKNPLLLFKLNED